MPHQLGGEAGQFEARLGGHHQFALGGQQFLGVELAVREIQYLSVVFVGDAQPTAAGADRQLHADGGDEVGLTVRVEPAVQVVEEPCDVFFDLGPAPPLSDRHITAPQRMADSGCIATAPSGHLPRLTGFQSCL
ncbi:hypothetical protein [Streptomyces sp. NBC_00316]|uniref:hypothetical protein n=1 Tax=Streptomyces sp. NBC_00316 TaxID=2975710 RepID=UPI002E2B4476|nr:hypothetical protein [Streptomyces sp. NBC_00316]